MPFLDGVDWFASGAPARGAGPPEQRGAGRTREPPSQVHRSNAFFHAAHIVASPFATTVVPGRADYPFTTAEGGSLTAAVAGVRQTFVVTTKDAMGNVRISEAEQDDFADKLVVDIVGPTILAGSVTYIGDGQYSIAYMPLKSGDYALHVKTGGSDIYCGLGDSDACSPFALDVAPGAATAYTSEAERKSNLQPDFNVSEAESAPAPRMDFLVESAAGDTGSFAIAAKDAYSNDLRTGGDEFSVLLTHREDADVQYRAYITDYNNGSYLATYTVPFAGAYDVYVSHRDEPLLTCVGSYSPFWWERAYDGVDVYKSPDYCDHAQPILEVVHGPLHAPTSSVIGPGVTEAMISGVKSKLTVQARDAFGNLRRGDDTTHFQYGCYGGETDQMGASDYFLVVFQHMTMDYAVTTSTAIQTVRIGNALDEGARRRPRESETREGERTYRLAFAGGKTLELPLNATAAALESALEKAHDDAVDVSVSRQDFAAGFGADHEYTITFLSDLDAWASDSLKVLSPEDGNGAAVAEVNISRPAAGGHYPVDFILGYVGEYELSVTSSGRHVEGSPFEVDCEHGVATSGATTVASDNINEAVAGDTIVLDVHARDHRQHEVQIVAVAAQAVDTVPEVQRVHVGSSAFTLTFRGATTSSFALGGTEATLEGLIEDLPTITGGVTVTEETSSDGTIDASDTFLVEFSGVYGDVPLLSTTATKVHEVTKGDAPYVREIQTFYCDATSGNLAVDFRDYDTTASLDVSTATVADLATELAAVGIAVSAWRHDDKTDSALTICGSGNTVAEMVYVEFLELTGDLPALEYNASSTALASSIVAYSGGNYGQVDGVHPVWGTFTLEFGGWTSDPIRADASADELRDSLEALPSIGDVSVYKTTIGQCLDQLDRQIFPNASCLSVWEVHFDGRCAISGWDFCPDTLGDVAMLAADASGLAYDLSPYERQAAPTVRVTEAIKGTTGNLVTSSGGDEIIEYSATHQQHTDVGIDMYETQRLRCATQSGGNFSLSMLNNATGLWETTTNVTGLTNIANLKAALLALPGVKPGLTVTGGNANGDICCTDATASTCAWVSVAFVGNFGTLPMLEFGEEQGVDLEIEEIVKGIDSLEYAGDGLYRLAVTPTVSGNYTFTLRISPQFFGGANATTDVSTELSAGLIVLPAQASGPQSHHYADLRATTAVESTFLVQARDRFGNRLGRSLDAGPGSHFAVDLNGTGFEGGGREGDRSLVAGAVDDKYVPNTDGLYEASYTPELAGPHVLEVELTQPGGLLATYYAQMDFVDPALHATGWRARGPTTSPSGARRRR
ncbi:hypothetical protein JL720_4955 [Aureococcus anophagefferens]|nr:hypothetical protein JL720_4955 [Aureococcus anophagefferens]